jgi:3-methyl-2-oxobutanoate hydroxymethyltransferase
MTLECVPPILGKLITERLSSVIVLGAGSGPWCDGQSINLYDIIGLNRGHKPKFVKRYAEVADIVESSIGEFREETKKGMFPTDEHCYRIGDELAAGICEAVEKI